MKEKKEDIAIWIQMILAVITFIVAIASIFIPEFLLVTEVMIALLLFDMAYNNRLLYHYKWVTPIYIMVGVGMVLTLVMTVMHLG